MSKTTFFTNAIFCCHLLLLPSFAVDIPFDEVPSPSKVYEEISAAEPYPEILIKPSSKGAQFDHTINFSNVPMKEFIKFISKISQKNFIFKEHDLDFKVSYVSGKASSTESVLRALTQILEKHHFHLIDHGDYYLVERMPFQAGQGTSYQPGNSNYPVSSDRFNVYKLQYHLGSEMLTVIKQMGALQLNVKEIPDLINAMNSLQWIESTNSLVYTASPEAAQELYQLIRKLDQPQKQVYIEVLVLETDVKDGLEFGLEWGGGGHIDHKLGFGLGNFSPSSASAFSKSLQANSASNPPSGASQFPLGRGFDLGVIGDLIFHKGKSFISLTSLVSALEREGKATIVLNQKILTQDNKSSSIFVGDNIPFTGSVVETVGASQQTTSNIEYRDVGVSLSITPLLGDNDVITLDIKEEITEARDDFRELNSRVGGIQTTKTNMVTRAHVPDKHFLVLSGMVRNSKTERKSGIPCLGGLPWIGAAFSKSKVEKEKKNIIVFVRPQIIHSVATSDELSRSEYMKYHNETQPKNKKS